MRSKQFLVTLGVFLICLGLWAAEGKASEQENTILKLVLKGLNNPAAGGGYTVVSPDTVSPATHGDDEIKPLKKYVTEQLQTNGLDVAKLVAQLFEHNQKSIRLEIASSRTNGFIIDYDGIYQKYFKSDGGGWKKWHQEHPEARRSAQISLPVYDSKSDFVLEYVGSQADWLAGSGWIILYRLENGDLKELKRVMLWIS